MYCQWEGHGESPTDANGCLTDDYLKMRMAEDTFACSGVFPGFDEDEGEDDNDAVPMTKDGGDAK